MGNGKKAKVESSFSWADEATPEQIAVLNIFYSKIPTLDATAEQCALLMAAEITGLVQQVAKIKAKSGGNGKRVKEVHEEWQLDSCAADGEDVDVICDEETFLHTKGYSDESRTFLKDDLQELTRRTVQIIQEDGQWGEAVREAARNMLEEAHEAGNLDNIEP